MAEITIYTASSSLQGKEVRSKFNTTFATLYRDLDDGFQPINFMAPWLPLPANRRRDHAQKVMEELYHDIIKERRQEGNQDDETDMIWTLMDATYRDGTIIPDIHIARLMIALLMGGQHNTAASGAWILLNLAHDPKLIEELYREQLSILGPSLPDLTWENLQKLALNGQVIKETLRLHSPIHSIMRQVKSPMPVSGTEWIIPPGNTLLASTGVPARDPEFFPNPLEWDPHRWDKAEDPEKAVDDSSKIDYGFGMVSKAANSAYLPFGAGRHRCLGEQYAYAQLGAIIATMVRLLKWEQVDPAKPVPATDYSVSFLLEPLMVR
jgi:sterol 14-demethylase